MAQQVKKKFIGNDQVDGSKILLEVGQTIRQKDGLGGEVDVIQSIEDSISSEQSRAEAAEAALDGRLTTAEGEIDQLQSDVVSNLSTAQAYTDQKIADLVDSAPALLDTLNELAAALGDDPNFVTTVTNLVADVQSDVDQEILDRQSADTALQGEIDSLETRMDTAESDISGLESSKVNRSGDNQLSGTHSWIETYSPGEIAQTNIQTDQISFGYNNPFDDKAFSAGINSSQVEVTTVVESTNAAIDSIILTGGQISLKTGTIASIPTLDEHVVTKKHLDDELSALSSGGIAAIQSELDATQAGAGLGTDGSYSAPVGSNYLGSAVSLKDADSKLDTQIKVVADDLAQEIIDRAADVDAEESRAIAAELVLQGNIDDVAADLAQEVLDRQADVDAEESRALAAEGVLQGNIDTVSSNLAQEILDRQADVDAEESRALAAEGVLQGNIDDVASDLAQEILDRQADVDAEQSRAEAAESALDLRIDVLESVVWFKEKFVVNATIISNGFVTLSHASESNSMSAFVDRLAIHEGAAEDYSISGATMTFLNDLVNPGQQALSVGDTIYVKYQYKM